MSLIEIQKAKKLFEIAEANFSNVVNKDDWGEYLWGNFKKSKEYIKVEKEYLKASSIYMTALLKSGDIYLEPLHPSDKPKEY